MRRLTWRRHHRWLGIVLCLFLAMFALSGIVLNHRAAVSDLGVSRKWLPARYRHAGWNGGLLRGTIRCSAGDSASSSRVLLYGTGGIWQTDSAARSFADFNGGLPKGADHRQIRSVAQTPCGSLYAVSPLGLWRRGRTDDAWRPVALPKAADEMLADATCHGDTLLVVGRSHLYLSVAPYRSFSRIRLPEPAGYRPRVTLFRTVWMLHSGELFGLPGRLVADAIAVALLLLCLTGAICWLLPRYMRHQRRRGGEPGAGQRRTMRLSALWHDRIGRATILLTLLITLTGWCLRPPVMIFLVKNSTPPIPGTVLDSHNPWNDKLRMARYDEACGDWLLSTSEGFYSLGSLGAQPVRIAAAPPVSVMGLNVLQGDSAGHWLCGSFSGLFVWDRPHATVTDYFTHEPPPEPHGPPFGRHAISGYSSHLAARPIVVDYYGGTPTLPQPSFMSTLPMPLWNVALEVHSGRIYIGSAATYVFILIAGIAILWCLWSGWRLRGRGTWKP